MLAATTSTTTMPELFDCQATDHLFCQLELQAGVKSWQLGWSHRKKATACGWPRPGCRCGAARPSTSHAPMTAEIICPVGRRVEL